VNNSPNKTNTVYSAVSYTLNVTLKAFYGMPSNT